MERKCKNKVKTSPGKQVGQLLSKDIYRATLRYFRVAFKVLRGGTRKKWWREVGGKGSILESSFLLQWIHLCVNFQRNPLRLLSGYASGNDKRIKGTNTWMCMYRFFFLFPSPYNHLPVQMLWRNGINFKVQKNAETYKIIRHYVYKWT